MRTATCKSCGASIVWATSMQGKPMCVDADPCEGGNVVLSGTERNLVFRVLKKGERAVGELVYRSHFSTCPNAVRHRTRSERCRNDKMVETSGDLLLLEACDG